jgi:hypothetical protein
LNLKLPSRYSLWPESGSDDWAGSSVHRQATQDFSGQKALVEYRQRVLRDLRQQAFGVSAAASISRKTDGLKLTMAR